jgi:hypothetical protein
MDLIIAISITWIVWLVFLFWVAIPIHREIRGRIFRLEQFIEVFKRWDEGYREIFKRLENEIRENAKVKIPNK